MNDNALTALPIDLVEDLDLEVLSLEFNRLNKLHVKLKDLSKLRALCLLENPIETLPRLNKSGNQRCLSLANVKVWKDEVTGDVDVKVQETGSSYFSSIAGGKAQKDKAYTAFLCLIFGVANVKTPYWWQSEGDRVEESRKLRSNSKYRGCVPTSATSARWHTDGHACWSLVHFEQGH